MSLPLRLNALFRAEAHRILLALFFLKCACLALFVIPLWDIPDETAHMASVIEIAETGRLPVLGRSTLPPVVYTHIRKGQYTGPSPNWIAQHPPVYYAATALVWRVSGWFPVSPEWRFRICRLVATAAGTLCLWILYLLILEMTGDSAAAFAFTALVSFIPMFSNLCAGVNHDSTLMLFSSLATLFAVRFVLRERLPYAFACAAMLAVAACTKLTAIVLIPPAWAFLSLRLTGPLCTRVLRSGLLGVTASLPPCLWLLRSWLLFGDPFVYFGDLENPHTTQLPDTFMEYLSGHPVILNLHIHFFGLFGWLDSGLLQIRGVPLTYYNLLVLLFCALSFAWIAFRQLPATAWGSAHPLGARVLSLLIWGIPLGAWFWNPALPADAPTLRLAYSLLTGSMTAAGVGLLLRPSLREQLGNAALLTAAFFIGIALWKLYGIYIHEHRFGAIHGRYFFPLIPLLLLGVGLPAYRISGNRSRPFLAAAALAGLAEGAALLGDLMPFYQLPA